jgi:cytochrome d ubiquinol oxidase subunit I
MVGLGTLFILLTIIGWFVRNNLVNSRGYLTVMLWSIPLPYLAIEFGWILAEVGRQPWIVWDLMRTSQAASPIAGSQVLVSLIAFILVYGLLGAVGAYLIFTNAKKGPAPVKQLSAA